MSLQSIILILTNHSLQIKKPGPKDGKKEPVGLSALAQVRD